MAGHPGSGGTHPEPECTRASDCKLLSDCCTCAAVPDGTSNPVSCGLVCIQNKCAQLQVKSDDVACVAGRCVIGFQCDASNVTCKTATPFCLTGEVPEINAAGTCYTQRCVQATQCARVTACSDCGGDAAACVTYQTQMGNEHHCVSVPAACGGTASCACLGPTTCLAPYGSCSNASGTRGLTCSCPNC
jgi:hypothetical protein